MKDEHIRRIVRYVSRQCKYIKDPDDWKMFLNQLFEDEKDKIYAIIFEQYNFPDLHYRIYYSDLDDKEIDMLGIMEDYFSDENGPFQSMETSLIYDVRKGKFFIINVQKSVDAKDVVLGDDE